MGMGLTWPTNLQNLHQHKQDGCKGVDIAAVADTVQAARAGRKYSALCPHGGANRHVRRPRGRRGRRRADGGAGERAAGAAALQAGIQAPRACAGCADKAVDGLACARAAATAASASTGTGISSGEDTGGSAPTPGVWRARLASLRGYPAAGGRATAAGASHPQ
eukprot:4722720-Prymnesium_polylepis.1